MEHINYLDEVEKLLTERGFIWAVAEDDELPRDQRKYKDTVFCMLFRKKTALLSLYNAVNGTHFDNIEDMEVATLENAIYMSMKNDVSFLFAFELNLYEHQSTVNPNIPLRDLFYVAKQLQKLISDKQLYSSKPVQLPTPRFVVFYNGQTNMPEKTEYKLSDLFQKKLESPELELTVTVYNINPGMNEELLEACQLLKEYTLFTAQIRENRKTMTLEDAINKSVDDCIRQGILADFLREQKAEVVAMSIYEYDQEGHMEMIREEGWEDGHRQGLSQGLTQGLSQGLNQGLIQGRLELGMEVFHNLMDKGFSRGEALAIAQLSEEQLMDV